MRTRTRMVVNAHLLLWDVERDFADKVVVVTAGILHQILLVGFVGGPKGFGFRDFGGDRLFPRARSLHLLFKGKGFFFLLLAVVKNGGAVLISLVVALAVFGGGIVHLVEVIHELRVGNFRRIELKMND